jgi:hypothetical protein
MVVRIEEILDISDNSPGGGWVARSLSHGRKVLIKDVSQIIHTCDEHGIEIVADETVPNRRSTRTAPLPPAIVPVKVEQAPSPILPSMPVKPMSQEPLNLLDAAVIVLKENKRQPMTARQITDAVVQRALWTPSGKTPSLTLHTALSREIVKGSSSRFRKAKEKGKFQLR